MVDYRTNYAKDVSAKVKETYGTNIPIFESVIPISVKAAEASAEGISIYGHCANCKVATAYKTDKGTIRIPYGKVDAELIKRIVLWCYETGNHA